MRPAFPPQRAGQPKQRNLTSDRPFDGFTVGALSGVGISDPHQLGDAVAVVDHALATNFRRMSRQYRHDQRFIQEIADPRLVYALSSQGLNCLGKGRASPDFPALPVFRQIGEHREEHEATNEVDHLMLVERTEARVDAIGGEVAAMPADRRRSDIFDASVQLVAAQIANDIAQNPAQETDVRVLLDDP